MKRALERNLDIAVERLNPQTFDFALASLQANYRPTFTSNFGMRSQSQFPRSQTAGGDILVTDTFTGNTGITQNVKWGGGSFAVGVQQQPAGAVRPVRHAQPGDQLQPQPPSTCSRCCATSASTARARS